MRGESLWLEVRDREVLAAFLGFYEDYAADDLAFPEAAGGEPVVAARLRAPGWPPFAELLRTERVAWSEMLQASSIDLLCGLSVASAGHAVVQVRGLESVRPVRNGFVLYGQASTLPDWKPFVRVVRRAVAEANSAGLRCTPVWGDPTGFPPDDAVGIDFSSVEVTVRVLPAVSDDPGTILEAIALSNTRVELAPLATPYDDDLRDRLDSMSGSDD